LRTPSPQRSLADSLADFQGNLIRPYGVNLPCARFLFLTFTSGPPECQAWLRQWSAQLTSAQTWPAGFIPKSTLNLAFTFAGLHALGVPDSSLQSFPAAFRAGMASRAELLGDEGESSPARWHFGGPAKPVHALVSVYSGSDQTADERLRRVRASLAGVALECYLQTGRLLPEGREHFGYRDGIGQPGIAGAGLPSVPGQPDVLAGEFFLGYRNESGEIPNLNPAELGSNGTFLVFRKLYQDVAAFRTFLREQARRIRGNDSRDDIEWLAARLVGRWRSGAPLAAFPDHDDPDVWKNPARANDFDYSEDRVGLEVPIGSHIRRANPRDGLPGANFIPAHRLLRRGIPYGASLSEASETNDFQDRGLMFIALNTDLERQFEFVQGQWLQSGTFAPGLSSPDQDPLVGAQNRPNGRFTLRANGHPINIFHLPRFVQMRGGDYFFVPSCSALAWLGNGGRPG
jgi:Dyp-type peroxidase family